MPTNPASTHPGNLDDAPVDLKLVFGVSVLLSLWLIYTDPLINRDGIIYLRAAEAYLQDGLMASQAMFGRPLLSVSIAVVHQLTGIPLLYSGLVITTLSYALLCCGFVQVVRHLGGSRSVQIVAAIVILSHPMLNEYRSAIMRDPPYWATMVYALATVLRFAQRPSLKLQVQWFALVILATMIRFEGILFALLIPLSMLFCAPRGSRRDYCMRLLLMPALTILLSLAALWYYQEIIDPGTRLFPDIDKHLRNLSGFPAEFTAISLTMADILLKFSAVEDANAAAIAGLAAILFLNLCRAMTWAYVLVLVWYFWRPNHPTFGTRQRCILNSHALVALLYLALFTVGNRFMLERYSGILSLFILPYVCLALHELWSQGKRSLGRIIMLVLLVAMSADTLHNGNSKKAFIREASDWLRLNTPADATLLSNQRQLIYFSERSTVLRRGKALHSRYSVSSLLEKPKLRCGYDFLAMDVRPPAEEYWKTYLETHSLKELKVFDGGELGRVVIVDLRDHGEADELCQKK